MDALDGQISVTPLMLLSRTARGQRKAFEEGLERHDFVDLGEKMFVAAKRISGGHQRSASLLGAMGLLISQDSSQRVCVRLRCNI